MGLSSRGDRLHRVVSPSTWTPEGQVERRHHDRQGNHDAGAMKVTVPRTASRFQGRAPHPGSVTPGAQGVGCFGSTCKEIVKIAFKGGHAVGRHEPPGRSKPSTSTICARTTRSRPGLLARRATARPAADLRDHPEPRSRVQHHRHRDQRADGRIRRQPHIRVWQGSWMNTTLQDGLEM